MSTHLPNALKPDSSKRHLLLLLCMVVALVGGTNYAYSSYSVQLAEKLGLSSTETSLIGAFGNVGNYGFSPIVGIYIDAKGPRGAFLLGSILLAIGYGGICATYEGKMWLGVWSLVVMGFLTGAGSGSGAQAALKFTAISYDDKTRATFTSLVLAFFGLSAFFFSSLDRTLFQDSTTDFLRLLAILPSIGMAVAWLGAGLLGMGKKTDAEGPDRHGDEGGYERVATGENDAEESVRVDVPEDNDEEERLLSPSRPISGSSSLDHDEARRRTSIPPSRSTNDPDSYKPGQQLDVYGFGLLKAADFWLLFIFFAMLSGTGLMWINSVGKVVSILISSEDDGDSGSSNTSSLSSSIVRSVLGVGYRLAKRGPGSPAQPDPDVETPTHQTQVLHVSLISIFNATGRFLFGLLSDFAVHRLPSRINIQIKRVWFIPLIALIFIAGMETAVGVKEVGPLIAVSILLGLGYGGMFLIAPMLLAEWFGLKHWSKNLGILLLSTILGSTLSNTLFGQVVDHNARMGVCDTPHHGKSFSGGASCYLPALQVVRGVCWLAFVLSLYIVWRHRR